MPSIRTESLVETESVAKDAKASDHPRVVMLGASGVGKTAIVQQFFYGKFPVDHIPTVEEMHSTTYNISGSTLALDVLDTSGYYAFPAMRRLAIKTGDAFILVYAIDDTESFHYVSSLRDMILEIRQKGEDPVPIVVVGNKSDLEDTRVVSRDITESVVTIDWEVGFVEASAKENVDIALIFKTVLTQAHICYALGTPMERRRKSLPIQSTYPKLKRALEQKRHSCVVQ
ncbi:ras-related protein Rap-1-like [Argiope bruennichi]|uniref:GTP-binding protein Rhes like protein n=1 Tax=Argiope bruennichi TaxID=94029 RepID=A0A8T0FUT0_ARGBR|nr:ras-related protein Rap-1-like [Argiope bruennichi]KAF8794841.1 GTP-binding protein Rhes like protein [Argiope bruennichi]